MFRSLRIRRLRRQIRELENFLRTVPSSDVENVVFVELDLRVKRLELAKLIDTKPPF